MYEYKCVGAPERARRAKGAKTRTDRVARALQEVIEAEANAGWEYLRTDLIPVEEKPGFFARPREVHRAVLIFRRAKDAASKPRFQDRSAPTYDDPPVRLAAEKVSSAEG